ncbi:MAG: GntR family transcriptional regulator [Blastocatellia bacterium]|nr:GntR family transcriptional regulator [Blastocatellia bacterium]
MRIWLSKKSDVSVREQLVAQIILGIISQELKPGQKLPSTRELARRYQIHPNTVNAAYRELLQRHWVEFRKGSGVFVRLVVEASALEPANELDQLISEFLGRVRQSGFALREVQNRLEHWFDIHPPDHLVVVENDQSLRTILLTEIQDATDFTCNGCSFGEFSRFAAQAGCAPVTLYSRVEQVGRLTFTHPEFLFLHTRSMAEALAGERPPSPETLVGVISIWPEFLKWAHTLLTAAGVDEQALSLIPHADWVRQGNFRPYGFVVTESYTAKMLPPEVPIKVFRMLSDESLERLRRLHEGGEAPHHDTQEGPSRSVPTAERIRPK